MVASQTIARKAEAEMPLDFDAIVIGAGVSGLYQLYRLRELGLTVRVFEAGTGVGGTWYWNRYPGARFDSESWTYGYSFSQELLDEWDLNAHFSSQPDNEGYVHSIPHPAPRQPAPGGPPEAGGPSFARAPAIPHVS